MKLSAARPASKQQNTAPRPRPVRTESSPSPSQEDLKAQELLISLFASGQIPKDMIEEKDFDDDELKSLYRELSGGASPASLVDLAPDDTSRSRCSRILLAPNVGNTDELIAMAQDCLLRIRRAKLEKRYEVLTQEIASAPQDMLPALLSEAMEVSDKLKNMK
jgi:DNA primase